MVCHELVTNATKYGALSAKTGKVDIVWTLKDEVLALHWRESGGPPVTQPENSGFGSSLIRGEIEYRLQGSVKIDFAPGGLEVHMEFPIGGNTGPDASPGDTQDGDEQA